MALIVEYHVIADMYPVGDTAITAGMCVYLSGGVILPAPSGQTTAVLGIAGDSKLTAEGQTTAYSDTAVIGANGANTRYTQNRVSDAYDETKASDKITVYHGGGKFWVSATLFNSDGVGLAAGDLLKAGAVAGEWVSGAAAGQESAIVVGAVQAYDSGVPGTDTTNGSMTLGNYVGIVLRV